jgi:CubicO group peptidase (beta-lactamase class C family)/ketosteroid isomerase-like protein
VPIPWPGLIGDEGALRSAGPIDARALDRLLKAYLDYYKIPGMSVAVIKDSKVVYHNGFGVRNAQTREPVTDDTVFEAASMTKPVCAYIVLRLVDRGVLDLDTPLHTYLPYDDIAYDDRYKLITARMVLTHRTGFPNWRNGKLDIKFTPGTQFSYSGEGFVYLGKVLEKLTGKKLVQLCREEVFEPLGIEHASLVWTDEIAKLTATGHAGALPFGKGKPSEPNMAASLHTDAKNYARFLIAYVQGKGLAEATAKDMLRSQGPIPEDPKSSFGLGVGIEQTPLGAHYGHGGRNTGFTSLSVMYKDLGIGYVFLVNNDDASKIENILNAYLITGKSGLKKTKSAAHKLVKVDPKIYDQYVGLYEINHETIVTVTRDGDRLMAQPSGDAAFELFPESETAFFVRPPADATVTFVKDAGGKISHAVVTRDSRKTNAKRLEETPSAARSAPTTSALFETIRELDTRLFDAFNALDAAAIDKFFTDDVEFYHDQGGLTRSREALVQTFRKKFREKDSRLRRELVEGSLEVYPISRYGAIETGTHRFFQTAGGQPEREVTVSRFVHVWQKTGDGWRISRAMSFDHKSVN